MKIQQLSVPKTINYSSVLKVKGNLGRIQMPVKKSQFLYARFKHIVGVPSGTAEGGMSISRLRALDHLIDRLSTIKGTSTITKKMTVPRVRDMAETIKKEFHGELVKPRVPYNSPERANTTGFFVNTFA